MPVAAARACAVGALADDIISFLADLSNECTDPDTQIRARVLLARVNLEYERARKRLEGKT